MFFLHNIPCKAEAAFWLSLQMEAGIHLGILIWHTLPETNELHLKMDGWNTFSFPFGARPIFGGKMAVSFRVSVSSISENFSR